MDHKPVQMAQNPKQNGIARSARKKFQFDRLTIGLLAAFGVVGIITAVVAFSIVRNLVGGWTMTAGLPGLGNSGKVATPS